MIHEQDKILVRLKDIKVYSGGLPKVRSPKRVVLKSKFDLTIAQIKSKDRMIAFPHRRYYFALTLGKLDTP